MISPGDKMRKHNRKNKRAIKNLENIVKIPSVALICIVSVNTSAEAMMNIIDDDLIVHDVYQAASDVSADLGYAGSTIGLDYYIHDTRDLNLLYDESMTDYEKQSLFDAADNLNFIISACNSDMKINVLPYSFEKHIKLENVVTVKKGANFLFKDETCAYYVPIVGEIVFKDGCALPLVFMHEILHHLGFEDDYLRPKSEQYVNTVMGKSGISLNDVKMIYAKVHDKKLSEEQIEKLFISFRRYVISKELCGEPRYIKAYTVQPSVVEAIEECLSKETSQKVSLMPIDDNNVYFTQDIDAALFKGQYLIDIDCESISFYQEWNCTSDDGKIKAKPIDDGYYFMAQDGESIYRGYYFPDRGVSCLITHEIISEENFDQLILTNSSQKLFDDYVILKSEMQGDIFALQTTLDGLRAIAKKIYAEGEECGEDGMGKELEYIRAINEHMFIEKKEDEIKPIENKTPSK